MTWAEKHDALTVVGLGFAADTSELRPSVLTEAAVLGAAASTVGLLTGTSVGQVTLQILQRTAADAHVPSSAPLSVVAQSPLLWARLTTTDNAPDVVPAIQDALTDRSVSVTGGAVERASFQRVIDMLLTVVVGLLGVAVVIALVGVATTLSLSVIERRRESATLRAIGLACGELRVMPAIEGMLIAGVGAVLGIGLGLVYGWAGAATMLGSIGPVQLAVPWRDLGLVLLVALVAGFVASVLPGRAAARTSPVAALAVD